MKHEKSSRSWALRIQDILLAINKVAHYLDEMTLIEFRKNELVLDAVIRNIEIIGEASKSIPTSIKNAYPNIPWKEMNGMRNVLIHEYFGVEAEIVWYTATRQLPQLKKQLESISLE